jgi:hypothetical protein
MLVEGGISAGAGVEADLEVLSRDVFIDYLDGEVFRAADYDWGFGVSQG